MLHYLLLLLLSISLIHCRNQPARAVTTRIPHSIISDTNATKADSNRVYPRVAVITNDTDCEPANPDTSVAGIRLFDDKTVLQVIGQHYTWHDTAGYAPFLPYVSSNNQELLLLSTDSETPGHQFQAKIRTIKNLPGPVLFCILYF